MRHIEEYADMDGVSSELSLPYKLPGPDSREAHGWACRQASNTTKLIGENRINYQMVAMPIDA